MRIIEALCFFGLISSTVLSTNELPTVDNLKLEYYSGEWLQVAAISASFQKKCQSDVRANYKALSNGQISVENSCTIEDGSRNVALGRARVKAGSTINTGKLEVSFVNLGGWLGLDWWVYRFGGDYFVTELGEVTQTSEGMRYAYTVVGHPKREFLWILTRRETKESTIAELPQIEQRLRDKGYDTCKIKVGDGKSAIPLCPQIESL